MLFQGIDMTKIASLDDDKLDLVLKSVQDKAYVESRKLEQATVLALISTVLGEKAKRMVNKKAETLSPVVGPDVSARTASVIEKITGQPVERVVAKPEPQDILSRGRVVYTFFRNGTRIRSISEQEMNVVVSKIIGNADWTRRKFDHGGYWPLRNEAKSRGTARIEGNYNGSFVRIEAKRV